MDLPSWYRHLPTPPHGGRHAGAPCSWDAAAVIHNTIPADRANAARLSLSDELVNAVTVKADDDLVANH
jgi:hypothetical protein